MIEITNRQKFPVQLVVRSRKSTNSFTTLNIPGIGAGKNVYLLEDERATEYITRVKDWCLSSLRNVLDNQN